MKPVLLMATNTQDSFKYTYTITRRTENCKELCYLIKSSKLSRKIKFDILVQYTEVKRNIGLPFI